MLKIKYPTIALMATLLFVLPNAAAQAQATRTWVSGVGDDANPCSRTAPCKTWAGAISKTAAGGEIDALDPGGFGALTITKAITIDGGGVIASALVAGTNGFNVAAASSDVVILRNLQFQGGGSGIIGINFSSGAALLIDHCAIYGFTTAGISASTSVTAKLFITDTTITNTAIGINLTPTGPLTGQIDHTSLQAMSTAGMNATGPVNMTMSNSSISNAATGVKVGAAGPILGIDSSQINNNATAFSTAGGFVRISRNILYDNNTNFTITAGTIASAGNNIMADNGATVPNGTVTQR